MRQVRYCPGANTKRQAHAVASHRRIKRLQAHVRARRHAPRPRRVTAATRGVGAGGRRGIPWTASHGDGTGGRGACGGMFLSRKGRGGKGGEGEKKKRGERGRMKESCIENAQKFPGGFAPLAPHWGGGSPPRPPCGGESPPPPAWGGIAVPAIIEPGPTVSQCQPRLRPLRL